MISEYLNPEPYVPDSKPQTTWGWNIDFDPLIFVNGKQLVEATSFEYTIEDMSNGSGFITMSVVYLGKVNPLLRLLYGSRKQFTYEFSNIAIDNKSKLTLFKDCRIEKMQCKVSDRIPTFQYHISFRYHFPQGEFSNFSCYYSGDLVSYYCNSQYAYSPVTMTIYKPVEEMLREQLTGNKTGKKFGCNVTVGDKVYVINYSEDAVEKDKEKK